MIKEVTMFTVVCDNCGAESGDDSEYSAWNDKGFAEDNAMDCGWYKEEDKHYCEKCFEGYDDNDKVIIKNVLPTQKK